MLLPSMDTLLRILVAMLCVVAALFIVYGVWGLINRLGGA